MLRFSDFSHLPDVDRILSELLAKPTGLIIVAGPDGRLPANTNPAPHFLPSGRQTILRILISELLDADEGLNCLVVTEERDILHTARRFRHRVEQRHLKPPDTYEQALAEITDTDDRLLVVDRLTRQNVRAVLDRARHMPAICQLDTVYHGSRVLQHLLDMDAGPDQLSSIQWVLSVQRLPMLCPICRHPAVVTPEMLGQLQRLSERYERLAAAELPLGSGAYMSAAGCPNCSGTGRQGDVAVFDFFQAGPTQPDILNAPSRLPLEGYIWLMSRSGHLALNDALDFNRDQLSRVYNLLAGSEFRASQSEKELERKIVELETANRVLEQRTRELVTLEGIGQASLSSADLTSLGARVLQSAMELCRADRAVLYYTRSADWAQVLAARGWPNAEVGRGLARDLVYHDASDHEQQGFDGLPPGIDVPSDVAPAKCGLAIPLVADGIPGGLMIIQSTRKRSFGPGEIALLETIAGHAAVAMQRANLIEQLQAKIAALEMAQVELAEKERMEREMELARELQLSMVPRRFPTLPGLSIAAHYAPATQVGGDFYDVILLPDDHVGIVVADVSDKGMPAALYMTLARTLIQAGARQTLSPRAVLQSVNSLLLEHAQPDMFVTVFYGVIDLRHRQLTYARAGHDHPLVVRDSTLHKLGGQGMALGLFERATETLTEEVEQLYSGDRLILYTDGLTDILSSDGRMMEAKNLQQIILAHASKPPDQFCEAVVADVFAQQGRAPQFDDMALLTVSLG